MPELPEVETLKKGLIAKTKGRVISQVKILDYKKIDPKTKSLAIGAKIKDVKRRAKILIIELSNNHSLVIHVKLTGYFHFQPKGKNLADKVTRVIFQFKDGSALLFEDVRKFGWIKIMKTSAVEKFLAAFCFGPDPLSKDFTPKKFKEILSKKAKSKIKPLLLDQCFIAGIGNIYAQEACYCAGILPMRSAGSLNDQEIKKMHSCIIKILRLAIQHQGTSAVDYVTVEGKEGTFGKLLKVYQQKKDPKGHPLSRIVMGSRGTSFCKICQK